MKLFIDTDNIGNYDELLSAVNSNIKRSSDIRSEIKKLQEMEIVEEIEEIDKYEKMQPGGIVTLTDSDEDLSYEYYYKNIKDASIALSYDELKELIKYNFPSKNNSNYFRLSNRIKAEIYREIIELNKLLDDTDDEEFLGEILQTIEFEKMKLVIINILESEKDNENEEIINNKIVFHTTSLGNVYALDDIQNIDSEYYESILELILSIQNGTFKNVKYLGTNNLKLSGISEVKGFKTRVIFDRIDRNTYVILYIFIKKSDNDKGYREAFQNRISTYRSKSDILLSDINDYEFLEYNEEILQSLIDKLSKCKKKVLSDE